MKRRQPSAGTLIRQGDVLLIPRQSLPEGPAGELPDRGGRLVLLEGEATGHAHTVSEEGARLISYEEAEQLYLEVYGAAGTTLEHDEHASLDVPQGLYEVRRQREWSPDNDWVWVQD